MEDVQNRIEEFILGDLLFGDAARMPAPEDSLVSSGIVDSTGILEIIEFIEAEFGVTVDDTETIPENLDGVARLTEFVVRKMG